MIEPMPQPPLKKREAIVSTDTRFGHRDYFHIKAVVGAGGWRIVESDINIDDWIEHIKEDLTVDYSGQRATGYCMSGYSFRDWWKQANAKARELYTA